MLSKRKTPPQKLFKCQALLVNAYLSNAQYHKPEATRLGLHGHFASYFFAPFHSPYVLLAVCGSKPEHGNADGFMLVFFSLRNFAICTWEIIPFKLNWVISSSVTACAVLCAFTVCVCSSCWAESSFSCVTCFGYYEKWEIEEKLILLLKWNKIK